MFSFKSLRTNALLLTLATAALLQMGCGKKSSNPVAANDDTPPTNSVAIKGDVILTPGNELVPTFGESNLSGYVRVQYSGTTQYLRAEFLSGNEDVLGGEVSVNGNSVTLSGKEYYASQIGSFPNVKFDGSMHNWNVAGSSTVPAFSAAVASPKVYPTLKSPASGAALPQNQSFTVEWTATGNTSDVQVLLYQLSASYHVTAALVVNAQGNSYTFTPEQLAIFQKGQISICLSILNHTVVQSGNKKFLAVAENYKIRHVNLQ